ncbi:nitroreductase [Streptomyces yaizuensis]|uniref:Nitroreductase n=1 Tax=Streptomyces yaizuensis TaxID=2989713 RepID=A0ABQ5NXR2_9ACTN|nr:nitroreductase [Streptomyces sp. YSPA8]GLF95019.1 nitroreductase [Streptomyces sp. YSPA8]
MPTTPSPVTAALARARSSEPPGPDLPPRPAARRPRGRDGGLPVPATLDPLLRHSVAGHRLRPVPSAGALHPVDLHLLAGAGSGVGLPAGQYAYDPVGHRLHPAGPAPATAPGDTAGGVFAVLRAAPGRTVAHYRHRGWPLTLLDTGHTVAALVAAGAPAYCLDLAARSLPEPRDGRPGEDPTIPLAVVRLTADGDPGAWVRAWDADGDPGAWIRASDARVSVTPWDRAPDARASVTSWARASVTPRPPASDTRAPATPRPCSPDTRTAAPPPEPAHPDLEQAYRVLRVLADAGTPHGTWHTDHRRAPRAVVTARRSADPGTLAASGTPDDDMLLHVLGAARAGAPTGPRWYLATGGPRPALLTARAGRLRTEARGPVLPTLAAWAAGQGWIARTGAVLLAAGCPSRASPARVRRDHLRAGYGVGHAHLAATALGLAARPVGSWQQADLGAALGGPAGEVWIVHGLAFGTRSPADVTDLTEPPGLAGPGPAPAPRTPEDTDPA